MKNHELLILFHRTLTTKLLNELWNLKTIYEIERNVTVRNRAMNAIFRAAFNR